MRAPDNSQTSLNLELVPDGTRVAEAFRTIDQEANKHRSRIVSLMKQRNTFAPISRLPPEVLCRVFYFASKEVSRSPLDWIKVSHVSQDWRNVAVNAPALWTTPPLHYPRWAEEMLVRSKMASLALDADFTLGMSTKTVCASLHHISRTRSLRIMTQDPNIMTLLLRDLPKSAPRLEALCLSIIPQYQTRYQLPDETFCDVYHLRRVELVGFTVDWDSQLLCSLTSLKLHGIGRSARPTRTQFWNALRGMPLLDSLDLKDTLPLIDSSQEPPFYDGPIHLPHLQQLTVASSATEIRAFLQGCAFPPTTAIKFASEFRTTTPGDFHAILAALSSRPYPSSGAHPINILTLELSLMSSGVSFRAFSGILSDLELCKQSCIPDIDLSFDYVPSILLADEITRVQELFIGDVFDALPLAKLIKLRLNYTILPLSVRTIVDIFGTLPDLDSLSFSGSRIFAKNIFLALQENLPITTNKRMTRSQSQHPPVAFPSLRAIAMEDVSFEEVVYHSVLTPSMLEDCLIWRCEHGAEIQELKLNSCNRISEDDISKLREIVVDVDWDGREMDFSDEEHHAEDDYEDYMYYMCDPVFIDDSLDDAYE
ncbi:hypothetical protein GALMADRAFT_1104286 [Galerina marginata CBS 339.88]|uniref:F-box domain-containing protein n=1 Tax=Galerina marginata (strain CBS 339.88) TaxID=685588 RepID=A0A067TC50_GALM3|nr:hypothetical protein GALMADRAFT_1104286 [Galerina marginata CBS 339.88]